MLTKKEANKLLDTCKSAREIHIQSNGIKAVSVHNRDSKRPEVIAILKGHETLWPPGTCQNSFLPQWMCNRTWYPFAKVEG
jgi:hypothetical protein